MNNDLIITADYHSHTTYSHGTGSVGDNMRVAILKGLDTLAITDHAINHPFIGVKRNMFSTIREDIEKHNASQNKVKLLFGLEANLIGMDGSIDVTEDDAKQLDILLAGFHLTAHQKKFSDYFDLVWTGVVKMANIATKAQIERSTKAYVNMVKNNKIDILTHPGFRLDVNYKEIGKVCADYGTYVELSSRHKTPNDKSIEELLATDCIFVIDSDAHKPENVASCDFAINLAKKYDIPESRIANINHKKLTLRSKA